jgi:hypothetical protein
MSDRAAYWRRVVERQAKSGLSIARFCEREDVSPASFYNWRRRLAEEAGERPAFVPVQVRDVSGSALEIVLPGAVTIRVPDGTARQTIVDALAAVEATA